MRIPCSPHRANAETLLGKSTTVRQKKAVCARRGNIAFFEYIPKSDRQSVFVLLKSFRLSVFSCFKTGSLLEFKTELFRN
jgi:hypothetical protein